MHFGQTVINKPHHITTSPFFTTSIRIYYHSMWVSVSVFIRAWIIPVFFASPSSLNEETVKCSHADMETQGLRHDINHLLTHHFHGNCSNNTRGKREPERCLAPADASEDDGWVGRSPICRAKAEICCPDTSCRLPSHSGLGDWRSELQPARVTRQHVGRCP